MNYPWYNSALFGVPEAVICPPSPALLEWRGRGQNVFLAGYPNNIEGLRGSPIRIFKTLSWAGSVQEDLYDGDPDYDGTGEYNPCFSHTGVSKWDYSGSLVVTPDPLHGEAFGVSGGLIYTLTNPDGTVEESDPFVTWQTDLGLLPFDESFFDNEYSETVMSKTGNGECIDASGTIGTNVRASGTATATLSNEDTEELALARYLASPTAWSDWSDFAPQATYLPFWVTASGRRWVQYFEQDWRVTKTGLLPSTEYDVAVQVWRFAPSEAPTFYATQVETGTTDEAGTLIVTGHTPNDRGYSTFVADVPPVITLSV